MDEYSEKLGKRRRNIKNQRKKKDNEVNFELRVKSNMFFNKDDFI